MDNATIRQKTLTVFRQVFKDKSLEIKDTDSADNIPNWDSLTHVILITSIEKEFNIKFALGELQELKNVGDLLHAIERKI